jgi:putative copper resistance protein D
VTLLAIDRAVHFLCLMAVFGAEAMATLLRAHNAIEVRSQLSRRFLGTCAGLALATAVLWLLLVAAQMSGTAPDANVVATVLGETMFGHAMAARLVLLTLLVAAILLETPRLSRVVLSGAALAAIALTSHAAAAGNPGVLLLRAANDAAHLLAAGSWLGGLVLLVPMVVRARGAAGPLIPALRLFSRWGIAAVAVIVIAGTTNAYLILFSNSAGRWSHTYLTLLAVKLVLAAIMIAIALANRFGLVPALRRGEPEARETLTLAVVSELGAGILIVAIVSFLGLLPPRIG